MARPNDDKFPRGLKLIAGAVGLVLAGFLWLALQATVLTWADRVLEPVRSTGKLCFSDQAPAEAESLMNQASRALADGNEARAQVLADKGDDLIEKAADAIPHRMLPYRDPAPLPGYVETPHDKISLLRSKIAAYRKQCFVLSRYPRHAATLRVYAP